MALNLPDLPRLPSLSAADQATLSYWWGQVRTTLETFEQRSIQGAVNSTPWQVTVSVTTSNYIFDATSISTTATSHALGQFLYDSRRKGTVA